MTLNINSAMTQVGALGNQPSPAQLVPEVYESFKSELLNMLKSLETGEDYKSPFFSKGVDPYSQAFPLVQNMTFSTYDQIISHLYQSLEQDKKWADTLANLF